MSRRVAVVAGRKSCSRENCQEINPQPVDNFTRRPSIASGYISACKTCRRSDRVRGADQQRARAKAWHERNRDRVREYRRERYAANPEPRRQANAAWRAKNADKVKEMFRSYREDGRYRVLNHAYAARRRARLSIVPAEKIDIDQLYLRDGGICQLCDLVVDRSTRWPDVFSESMDHVYPISLGGAHVWQNVQLAHLGCNMKKGNRV